MPVRVRVRVWVAQRQQQGCKAKLEAGASRAAPNSRAWGRVEPPARRPDWVLLPLPLLLVQLVHCSSSWVQVLLGGLAKLLKTAMQLVLLLLLPACEQAAVQRTKGSGLQGCDARMGAIRCQWQRPPSGRLSF